MLVTDEIYEAFHDGYTAVVADATSIEEAERAGIEAALKVYGKELLEALKGVVAVADRKTDEFDRARAAIAKATGSGAA